MTTDPVQFEAPAPKPEPDGEPSSFQRIMHQVFLGPHGIRAGWRILIAVSLFLAIVTVLQAGLRRIPPLHAWSRAQPKGVMTPGILALSEGTAALALLLAALIMTAIEKRSLGDYGLPGREAFGKRFWQGMPYGFVMMSAALGLIAVLHGVSIEGLALGTTAAVHYGLLYLLGFILVGFFEEFSFRGYLQATLASGIGFWWAAIALSILFGTLHMGNPGEARFGALMAGCFGLLAAFSLRRTGSIWFAIGMHAAWDWGETYFYGVPDSGIAAQGHLLNASFHGPVWLTGGTVGPEASVFSFVVLILSAAGLHFMFPAKPKET
jgi:membrane protease YdiL (CAAX protease family)